MSAKSDNIEFTKTQLELMTPDEEAHAEEVEESELSREHDLDDTRCDDECDDTRCVDECDDLGDTGDTRCNDKCEHEHN